MSDTLPSPDARETAVYDRLRALGITFHTVTHEPVFTVEESQAVLDRLPGGHTKNLFLKDKKSGLWLVVVRAHLRVDLAALAKTLGAPRFSFGAPALLIETLGITPGAVTPFALMNDSQHVVRPVLDSDMLKLRPLNFHPLRNDRTTAISPEDLLSFVKACGHAPILASIPQLPG